MGASSAAASNRAIATYDTSGYTRGAAAMGEGTKDLGAGIMTAGKALGAYAAQQAEAERKIGAVRSQVDLTAKQLARGNAIARDTDPAGLVARHVGEAAKEFEQAAGRVSDPRLRSELLFHRDGYVAEATRTAERRKEVLSAGHDMSLGLEATDALGAEALQSDDPSAMNRAADVFHDYVDTLREVGWVDDAKAADIKRTWATGVAERALLQAPAADRVAAIAAAKAESGSEGSAEGVPAEAARTDTPADAAAQSADKALPQASSDLTQLARLLPLEVRERIDLQAQAEIGRTKATRAWEKTGQYEDAMEKAGRGEPQPAPWRAAIEADPDLDGRTRARLLKQHDAMQQKLDTFWSAKAEYDKPNGRRFDGNDRTFVEQMYTRLGADNAALHAVVNRTGIMPDAAVATMNGDLTSNDSERVARTVERLERISAEFPALLAARDTTSDLQNAITQYRYELARGAAPADAIRSIIQIRSPEYQQALDGKNKNSDLNKEIAKVTSLFDLDKSFAGDPASMAIMYMTYRDVAQERLRATGDPWLARAQALEQLKPIAGFRRAGDDSAKQSDATPPDGWVPTRAERAWYNGIASFYLGTGLGAAMFSQVAAERRMVEAGASDEELLRKFYPALLSNRHDQKGHRKAALKSLMSAPERHKEILADLARYNAMKGYSTWDEAAVALLGQVGGSLPTPETLAAAVGKGVTWGARFVSDAWRQGAVNGAIDPAVQAMAIAGGGQDKYDPWQHAMSVGVGADCRRHRFGTVRAAFGVDGGRVSSAGASCAGRAAGRCEKRSTCARRSSVGISSFGSVGGARNVG